MQLSLNEPPDSVRVAGGIDQSKPSAGGERLPGNVQFVSFFVGKDQYGVDIMAVREIKGWSDITPLPRQPEYIRGVLNLRGVMVPIIDLRSRFGQGMTQATPMHIVIIVQIAARLVGLLADQVSDIIAVDASRIQAVPKIARGSRVELLSGLVTVEQSLLALIELSNLIFEPNEAGEEAGLDLTRCQSCPFAQAQAA